MHERDRDHAGSQGVIHFGSSAPIAIAHVACNCADSLIAPAGASLAGT
jgi:hypothetical protein